MDTKKISNLIDDSEPITQSKMADVLFTDWAADVIKSGVDRFLAKNRENVISQLIGSFIEMGINYNTVVGYSKKVKDVLVTKEGKKNTGKYKGWVGNVEEEYTVALLELYRAENLPIVVEDIPVDQKAVERIIEERTITVEPTYGDDCHLSQHPLITAWAKHKFDYFYNSQLDLLAHRIGHELNVLFQKEVLKSDWVITRNNVPDWAIDVIQAN